MARSLGFHRFPRMAFAVMFAMPVISVSPAAGGNDCRVVPGHVEFRGLELVPPNPVVGDIVSFHFDVRASVYFVSSIRLYGTNGIFHGTTVSSDANFLLDTLLPGEAVLQIEVVYGTEEYCESGGYWKPGPHLSAISPEYVVSVGEGGATEIPTPTATPTPPSSPTRIVTPIPRETASTPECPCDCDGNGSVGVNDLIRLVQEALGRRSGNCPGFARAQPGIAVMVSCVDLALRRPLCPTDTALAIELPGHFNPLRNNCRDNCRDTHFNLGREVGKSRGRDVRSRPIGNA